MEAFIFDACSMASRELNYGRVVLMLELRVFECRSRMEATRKIVIYTAEAFGFKALIFEVLCSFHAICCTG